jgi:hypothetical protein
MISYFKNILFDDVFIDNRGLVVASLFDGVLIGFCWSRAEQRSLPLSEQTGIQKIVLKNIYIYIFFCTNNQLFYPHEGCILSQKLLKIMKIEIININNF